MAPSSHEIASNQRSRKSNRGFLSGGSPQPAANASNPHEDVLRQALDTLGARQEAVITPLTSYIAEKLEVTRPPDKFTKIVMVVGLMMAHGHLSTSIMCAIEDELCK